MPKGDLTEYRLTPAAQSDLEDIWEYMVQNLSLTQADHYIDILEDTIEQLLILPDMAKERHELTPAIRIQPSSEHLIVYHVVHDYLVILRILGAGQHWHANLRSIDK
jgi:toxin ParE1/3/4